ncbi:MAG TPA: type II secretion system protein [Capsulimonadaceae bacterium]
MPPARQTHAFTLTELLVAISVVAVLAALLFPAFAQARETARQSTCQSNIRSVMGAILQYAQDNDDCMPISWNITAQVGPRVAADSIARGGALEERGLHVELADYSGGTRVFRCADDKGVQRDINVPDATSITVPFTREDGLPGVDAGAVVEPAGTAAADIFGMSYKFTKENFTFISGVGGQKYTCIGTKTACLGKATGAKPTDYSSFTAPPPNPMPLSFFARPSETRMLRDFLSLPDNTERWANPSTYWHPHGEIIGFADGHVKLIHSSAEERALCDGPTLSPAYDGSCNTKGLERYS